MTKSWSAAPRLSSGRLMTYHFKNSPGRRPAASLHRGSRNQRNGHANYRISRGCNDLYFSLFQRIVANLRAHHARTPRLDISR